MKIVEGQLQVPNVCVICEQHPDVSFVDTLRELQSPDRFHPLMGRKYVCLLCLDQMAKLAGYEHSTKVEEAREFLTRTQRNLVELRQAMGANTQLILETFHNLPDAAISSSQPVITPADDGMSPTTARNTFLEVLKAEIEGAEEVPVEALAEALEPEAVIDLIVEDEVSGEEEPELTLEDLLGQMPEGTGPALDEPVIVEDRSIAAMTEALAPVIADETEAVFKPAGAARHRGGRPKAGK